MDPVTFHNFEQVAKRVREKFDDLGREDSPDYQEAVCELNKFEDTLLARASGLGNEQVRDILHALAVNARTAQDIPEIVIGIKRLQKVLGE